MEMGTSSISRVGGGGASFPSLYEADGAVGYAALVSLRVGETRASSEYYEREQLRHPLTGCT